MTDNLELPIERIVVDGPIVRAHATRKEENNHERMTAERLTASYEAVRQNNLDALRTLSEQSASA